MPSKKALSILCKISVIGLVLICGLFIEYKPSFEGGVFKLRGNKEWQTFGNPLWLMEPKTNEAEFRITMILGKWYPTRYFINSSGIDSLWINGIPVNVETVTDLSGVLHAGKNEISGRIHGPKKPFPYITYMISPSIVDVGMLVLAILAMTCAGIATFAVALRVLPAQHHWLAWLASGGTALRVLYVFGNPHWFHSYDWQGHREYILFILEQSRLPPAAFGWETFQPPLYYVISAIWMKLAAFVGQGYESLQILSIIISIITLGVGLWIGTMLFKENAVGAFLFGLIIAVFPGLVFLSSQITNDGLLTMLMFIAIGLLLRWNVFRKKSDVMKASFTLGLALLTKSTALLLLPILAASIIFAIGLSLRQKVRILVISSLIIVTMTGWFFAYRFLIEKETSIVGNQARTDSSLIVPLAIRDFIVFNPFITVVHPFTDDLTSPRREILFEDLFKTAHFGNRYVTPMQLASLLLLSGLFVITISLVGCFVQRLPGSIVLNLTAAFLLLGIILHRYITPSTANQEMRFILPIIIPIAAYAIQATMKCKKSTVMHVLIGVYAALSVAVIVRLCV